MKHNRPESNETFIRLVQSLRENGEVADLVRQAGKLPKEVRAVIFEQMAAKMRAAGEPEDLAEAVTWLREDAVFRKLLEVLDAEGPS